MEFKFDADQEYQVRAIESVVTLFNGQPLVNVRPEILTGAEFVAIANRLDLDDDALLTNTQAVQASNGLPAAEALGWIESEIETVSGPAQARFANFSVEMETGTGKTYVYLRTALELFRRYGLRKFVVVVPSVAVREGVLKTLEITGKHLRALYGNLAYRYYVYASENLAQVRQFALSDSVEIMVMTIDSFNKATNVIRQTTDRLQGETPIHLIQAARPILILDEPQNMESEARVAALAALRPLFALRYSATHRNPYTLIYRLTPAEAYRQGLVKRVAVAGIEKESDANQVFLRLESLKSEKKTFTARLAVHKLLKDGSVKEQVVTVRPGDRLEEKTDRPEYAPYVVDEINVGEGWVSFANGAQLQAGETRGADKAAIFEAQIRYTIETHFKAQRALRPQGIKILSLFFIDRVDNYVLEDGLIRRLFMEAFNELKAQDPDWQAADPAKVQAAYFAARRTKSGEVIYEDSKTGEAERDRETYDLIMRDKERLLSFDEPTCFIFSHSALREGWDSPNVFQICTLNQTASEIKKRQEIGRGVRLAVNQSGDRVRDERVNVLTVVANESYAAYCAKYQQEIETEYGLEGAPPKPINARERGIARLRKHFLLKPEFQALWEQIRPKTRYMVDINTALLVADVVAELDQTEISPPRLMVTKAWLDTGAAGEKFSPVIAGQRVLPTEATLYAEVNLLDLLAELMAYTTPPVCVSQTTLLGILGKTKQLQAGLANPHEFAAVTVRIIKRHLADQLINGIQYIKINEWYEMTQFQDEMEGLLDQLIPANHSLYSHVIYESDIERKFVEDMEQDSRVKLYVKLPAWFVVPTPIGDYNPDWAIVWEPHDEQGEPTGEPALYLVRETKGADPNQRRPDENRKITCGERHFREALGVSYKVVSSARDLP